MSGPSVFPRAIPLIAGRRLDRFDHSAQRPQPRPGRAGNGDWRDDGVSEVALAVQFMLDGLREFGFVG